MADIHLHSLAEGMYKVVKCQSFPLVLFFFNSFLHYKVSYSTPKLSHDLKGATEEPLNKAHKL